MFNFLKEKPLEQETDCILPKNEPYYGQTEISSTASL
jgi:hypothetical protein